MSLGHRQALGKGKHRLGRAGQGSPITPHPAAFSPKRVPVTQSCPGRGDTAESSSQPPPTKPQLKILDLLTAICEDLGCHIHGQCCKGCVTVEKLVWSSECPRLKGWESRLGLRQVTGDFLFFLSIEFFALWFFIGFVVYRDCLYTDIFVLYFLGLVFREYKG